MMNDQSMLGQMDPENLPQQSPEDMPPEVQTDQMGMDPAMAMGQQEPPAPVDEEANLENIVDFALDQGNLAKKLDKEKLLEIGEKVHKGWEADEESRKDWMDQNEEWIKLALLKRTNKTFPWPKASNVKYPLLSTAAMQFSARAYPALVPADGKVVKARVIPYDPDGKLSQKAERIARHMSYQILCEMDGWEEDMDKLLMTMAISGICFKKTFHNKMTGKHESKLVYPENFVINYWAKDIESAYRKTELLFYNENEYVEKVRNNNEYLDIGLEEIQADSTQLDQNQTAIIADLVPSENDEATPFVFLSQHTFLDLDDDGYEEPYIVTVHRDTKKVVRITARWDQAGVFKDEKGKIIAIKPVETFTAFPFIPNPDGSIYALGFGLLLGPINESVNSLINQLVDSGTLNNLQSGFIGKGLRLKFGPTPMQPGEWKVVNATGDDLSKSIFPLPTKEPSAVLMNLMNLLITSGNQLASIAEIMVGKMPGQNTPATTTQETVKQGMAVFTAVYKRVYRAALSEYKKLYRLNRITPGIVEKESKILGVPLQQSDYDNDNYIVPGGDPTGDSESTKAMKVQQVMGLMQMQTLDPMAVTAWAMQAMEIPNYQGLLMKPQPPQPDPEAQKMEMEMQMEQQKAQMEAQAQQQKLQIEQQLAQLKIQLEQAKLEFQKQKQAMDMQGQKMKLEMDMVSQVTQQRMDEQQMQHDMQANQVKTQQDLETNQAMNDQKLKMGEETLKQKKAAKKIQAKSGGNKPKK